MQQSADFPVLINAKQRCEEAGGGLYYSPNNGRAKSAMLLLLRLHDDLCKKYGRIDISPYLSLEL